MTKTKMREMLTKLMEARRASTMERMGIRPWFPSSADQTVTFKNGDITDFVKEQTQLYRDSWIIGPIDEVIEALVKEIQK